MSSLKIHTVFGLVMRKWSLIFILLTFSGSLHAQQTRPPFWDDIQAFKKQDSIHFPPQRAILFVGSSSFTRWYDLAKRFPETTVINRGFGGSSLPNLIYYSKEVILPYHPRQIIVYCGENDFAGNDSVTVAMVVERFEKLFEIIRKNDRNVLVSYISMKPSPSRVKLLPKFQEANGKIKLFLSKRKRTSYIEVYSKMLNADGTIMADIFTADQLHMNEKGYDIWQMEIKPHLIK